MMEVNEKLYAANASGRRYIILRLERMKETNPELYRVYGEGETGVMHGSIFINPLRRENCHAIRYVLNRPQPKPFGAC